MIELHNFSIGYESRKLLDNVNAAMNAGSLTALIGRNGSGKSTLLRAIAGLNSKYTGNIVIDGLDITKINTHELAHRLAFVNTQRTRIANLTCLQLVGLGRTPYTDWIGRLSAKDTEAVEKALEAVGMQEYSRRTLDTMSDGECQRVMVARALAQDTPVILLDEPTSFLDLPNRYELCVLLGKLAHELNKCVLFSTHELEIAMRMCDNIALVDNPHLHIMPTDEMRKSGLIERLFGKIVI
ncbi:ABC transporter ATP-binding protein [uncultured Muribaculum sp.]|uniref:ABC transporter ATP-binding protein n=1 Tax=uncultured Muribaculum sp. TaxID=1918613 RepID=UPI0025A9EDB9|nr:ABC transporter ATP-binding protein [uncultured Muribaculum sp.]